MNRLDRQNLWGRITPHRLPLVIGAGAVTWFGLLAAPGLSDRWPYTTASVPFSLKIKVIDYDRNSSGKLAQVTTQDQRPDGTSVIVNTMYRSPVPRTFRAIILPDGTWVRLLDTISAKSTCRPKHREAAPARETLSRAPRPPNCLGPGDKLLGQTVLFGQQVDVVKTWDRGSGGEEWLAPALGCKELQWQSATLQPDGSRKIESEGKLVRFSLGEPDARLFDLGNRYAEITPSELLRREMKAAGVRWSPELAKESVEEDERYATVCQMPTTPPQ